MSKQFIWKIPLLPSIGYTILTTHTPTKNFCETPWIITMHKLVSPTWHLPCSSRAGQSPKSKLQSQVQVMLFPTLENVRASWRSGDNCLVSNFMLFVTSSPEWYVFSKSLPKSLMKTEYSPLALNHSSIKDLKLFLFLGIHSLTAPLCLTQFNPIASVKPSLIVQTGLYFHCKFLSHPVISLCIIIFNGFPRR